MVVLGSTGSIGRAVLEVVSLFRDRFSVEALAAGGNIKRLKDQIQSFSPKRVAVRDEAQARDLQRELREVEVLWGEEGLVELASMEGVDLVVVAVAGSVGFMPTLAALERGKRVALATKEVLVMGGEVVMATAKRRGGEIIPIDSEHSAILQLLEKRGIGAVRRLILTASGGPFYSLPPDRLEEVTPQDALRHPIWRMGAKISVDSATMMNKALEVVEAHWLFGIPPSKIEVFIHPQGVVHGMVEFVDGVVLAHMGVPDMRIPIAYALSYPERLPLPYPPLKLPEVGPLTFDEPDRDRFPALGLAYRALSAGGTMPAVLNAADEVAVEAFLEGRLPFKGIVEVVREVMDRHGVSPLMTPEDVLRADRWAREEARREVERRR